MGKNKTGREQETNIERSHIERILPYKSVLFFSLVGSSILFLSLTFLYIMWLTKEPVVAHINIPKPFIISTIVMLISSYTVTLAQNAFRNDDSGKLLLSFFLTLSLTLIFVSFQIWGWIELYDSTKSLNATGSISFLYIISGLHFLHLGVALLWQFYISIRAFDVWNDPVKALLYFSNRFEGTRIDLFSTYWHYLDVLWLCIFLTFLFTL